MRLDDTQIKQAILHPNPEIRVKAMNYFVDSCSDDPSVMPVVIETVEKHGRESALFRTLRRADSLAQSPATIDWLINELNLDCDPSDKKWDNYLLSIAMILKNAAPNRLGFRVSREADSHPRRAAGPSPSRLARVLGQTGRILQVPRRRRNVRARDHSHVR